ncbi:MAG: lysophospholipid acyltransferase family protein [Bacillota bacterium]|jgi:1-acyl-sn-glycerol-3-phosphate acyltransferase
MFQSVSETGKISKAGYGAHFTPAQRRWVNLILTLFGGWVTVEHPENLSDIPGPAVFAFNHNNTFETLLVPVYLFSLIGGQKFSFVVDWMFGRVPGINWFLKQIDPIYVYSKPSTLKWLNSIRKQAPRLSTLAQCLTRLHQGQSLGIFPEGTRNRHPATLLKAKKGLGHLILLSQVPVIPIGIDFPRRMKRQKIPAYGPMILRIGQPLRFDITRLVLQTINAASELTVIDRKKMQNILAAWITYQIMRQIAQLSGKRYPYPQPLVPREYQPWLNAIFPIKTDEGGDYDGLCRN